MTDRWESHTFQHNKNFDLFSYKKIHKRKKKKKNKKSPPYT